MAAVVEPEDPLAPGPAAAASRENALEVVDVGKCYRIYKHPADRLRQAVFGRLGYTLYEEKWALRDVTFALERGIALGVIGRNGAGKSTLLQIIAGTLAPTSGRVSAAGRVVALLELGSGFNVEFTGRENVFLYGALYGLTRGDIERRFDAIAAFADIGSYLERPVKTYSTGMAVRLAFAVIAHLDPDILIVDEALAVGDVFFQHKCMRHIGRLLDGGTSLLFASHGPDVVKRLCRQALFISDGRMAGLGDASQVVEQYLADIRMEAATVPGGDGVVPDDRLPDAAGLPAADTLPLCGQPVATDPLVCRGSGLVREFDLGEQSEPALTLTHPDAVLGFRVQAHGSLQLVFGAHAHAGRAFVVVDGATRVVNLYSLIPRRLQVQVPLVDTGRAEHAVYVGIAGADAEAHGQEVWFLEGVTMTATADGAVFKRSGAFDRRAADGRYGAGGATVRFAELLDTGTHEPVEVVPLGAEVILRVHAEVSASCEQLDVSFIVRNREGHDLFGTTAHEEGMVIPGTPGMHLIDFQFANRLRAGSYSVHVALVRRGPQVDHLVPLDVVQIAAVFQVTFDPRRPIWYLYHEPVAVRTAFLGDLAAHDR